MSTTTFKLILLVVMVSGCVTASNVRKQDRVSILLKDGTKIDAQVVEISNSTVTFEAIDRKKAFDFGNSLRIDQVRGIEMANGDVLTIKQYQELRNGGDPVTTKRRPKQSLGKSRHRVSQGNTDLQYDEIKDKPVAEMTDNEFQFFMMMKGRELQLEDRSQTDRVEASSISTSSRSVGNKQLGELVDSIVDAELVPNYLIYLEKKSRSEKLTSFEKSVRRAIENNPNWQEQSDDIAYFNRTAKKALSRAYTYNAEELNEMLDVPLDQDAEMDFLGIIQQLHRQFGDDVRTRDFRTLKDTLGESGAAAVRQILENYAAWQYVVSVDSALARK